MGADEEELEDEGPDPDGAPELLTADSLWEEATVGTRTGVSVLGACV